MKIQVINIDGKKTENIELSDKIFSILFLIPFIVVVSKYSIPYVLKSWDGLEKSREAGGIPFLYIYKTSLLLFCIPLFFQTISLILRCFLVLSNKKQKIFFKLKN